MTQRQLTTVELSAKYPPDANGFISFGDIARGECNQQCQYASEYVYGFDGRPNLGDGLRFDRYELGKNNYHALLIHIDDAAEFVRRYHAHRAALLL